MTGRINLVPAEGIDGRFDRLEKKIDKLSEAMISLARTEEKMVAMESNRSDMLERIHRQELRVDELTEKVNTNSNVVNLISKLVWVAVTGVITAAIGLYIT